MSEYRRWRAEAATYFFTIVTYARRPLFNEPTARRVLRDAFETVRRKHPVEVFAAVLLPDHLHCIWMLPQGDSDFSIRWSKIKLRFTRVFLASGGRDESVSPNRRARGERGVWQRRFWEHLIRDERECLGYRDYIHLNPVKHGYVRNPSDWPWSSVHRHLRLGWLEPEWTGWTPIDVPISADL